MFVSKQSRGTVCSAVTAIQHVLDTTASLVSNLSRLGSGKEPVRVQARVCIWIYMRGRHIKQYRRFLGGAWKWQQSNEDEAHVARRRKAHMVWNSGLIEDARALKIYRVKRWSNLYDKALIHVYDLVNVFTI